MARLDQPVACARSSIGRRCGAPSGRKHDPARAAMRAARQAVKVEKAQDLMRLAGDVGPRADPRPEREPRSTASKLAEGPRDMSRIARLAATKGGKTRAILKLAGRGAIMLTVGTFNLASGCSGRCSRRFGFVSSLKRMTERATERYCARRKLRRARERERCRRASSGNEHATNDGPLRAEDAEEPTVMLPDVAGARAAVEPAIAPGRRLHAIRSRRASAAIPVRACRQRRRRTPRPSRPRSHRPPWQRQRSRRSGTDDATLRARRRRDRVSR